MISQFQEVFDRINNTLWHTEMQQFNRWQQMAIRAMRITYLVFRDVRDGLLPLRAMSLVYTTLLSIVPLLAVSFSVLKGFGVHNQVEPLLLNLLAPLGDQGIEITQNIIGFVEKIKVGVLGTVGLALLLYTVIFMIQKVETSFNFTWRVTTHRSFGQRFSNYLSVLFVGPVLVFSAMGLTATIMSSAVVQQLIALPVVGILFNVGGQLVPYLLVIAAFTFVYIFVPNTKVHFKSALIGALVAGVMWETTGWLFAAFVINTTKYTAIYSALATLIIFMFWLYASWVILLVGTNIAYYHQNPEQCRLDPRALQLSLRQREKVALLVMALVGKHFYQKLPRWTLQTLANELGLPGHSLQPVVNALLKSRLLVETNDDPPGLLPQQPLEIITVADILSSMRRYREASSKDLSIASDKVIDDLYAAVEQAMDTAVAGKTLKDIASPEMSGRDSAASSNKVVSAIRD